uniref:TIMELESS-interacting protein n=1 Tax=Petromyzon marinus TaxID=7757 RepID=S4RS67_PETMA
MELFDDSDEDRVRAPPEDRDPDRRENFGDEAELQTHSQAEGKPVPVKKIVKRPRLKLDAQRLSSERGLPALRKTFENVKFKGKGHEVEDLKLIMKNMEHWAHRLFPKMQFDDIIDKMEVLGSKREVQNCLKKIRLDIPVFDEDYRTIDHDNGNQPMSFVFISKVAICFALTPMSSTPAPQLTDEQRERIDRNRRLAMERRIAKLQSADVPITSSQSQE